jgi:predicted PurR-regulated permease PerM
MCICLRAVARTGNDYTAWALWTLAIIALVFFLRSASQLLIPIVIAVLISYALEPVVAWLAAHRVPRLAGASLVLGAVLGVAAWGAYTLRDDAAAAVEALPEAARRAREMVWSQEQSPAGQAVKQAAQELKGGDTAGATGTTGANQGGPQQPSANDRDPSPESAQSSGPAQPAQAGQGQTSSVLAPVATLAQRAMSSVLALLGHITVIFFLVFFLLLAGGHFRERVIEIAGSPRLSATIIDDINAQIQRFLLVRLITGAVVAAATWLVLMWMGVQQAAVWGILAGVFNSIPYFGPVIVGGGLLVVGLIQTGDFMQAMKISGASLLITSLEGWLLTPPLLGKTERMHVLVVFLGVLLWTWIWGAWGTILAVPMLVILKSVADHVESLKPVSRLMAP